MNQLEKIRANFKAIEHAWKINEGGFPLTEERKGYLNGFTGWGGCNAMLLPLDKDWKKAGYSKEYLKVEKDVKKGFQYFQSIFGKQNAKKIWEDIATATLTSFYTPKEIPNAFFKELAIQNKNNAKGLEVLDPCAGSGVYIDACLEYFPDANITAVEKDFLTAFLLRAKYKDSSNVEIYGKGFEEVKFKDKKFDVIASNIPFGDFKVAYPSYDKVFTDKIHNFFFYHSQNLLKEQGILSFITSTGVFNSVENKPIREQLLKEGYINSFKVLPNNTFEDTSVASHIVSYVKNKEIKNTTLNQELFLETQKDSNNVFQNQYILENKETVYLAEPQLKTNQYGKYEYVSKVEDFQKGIEALSEEWKNTFLKIETVRESNRQEISRLVSLSYPQKKVSNINVKRRNLIEEISFIREGYIPDNFWNFKVIATIQGRYEGKLIPLVTVATGVDKNTKKKSYYFQGDTKEYSFLKKQDEWIDKDATFFAQEVLESLNFLSQKYQVPISVDFRKDEDGIRFNEYFRKNYKKANLEYAYFNSEEIDFKFHREVQENDIFITKKGNVAQILEIKEIIPNIDAEFPQKYETYKVKRINIEPNNEKKVVALLRMYSTYSLMMEHHQQFLNGVEWSLEHLEENKRNLNKVYDDFVQEFGQINSSENKKILQEYKDLFKNYYYVLTALESNVEEKINPELPFEEGNIKVIYQKSGIFNYDYAKDFKKEISVDEALVKSFSRNNGKIDIQFIQKVTNKKEEEILASLQDIVIFNPISKEFELKETFLKGNIYDKKEKLEKLPDSVAKEQALYLLEEYYPDRIPFHNIIYQMGSRWIPEKFYKEFLDRRYNTSFRVFYEKESDTFYAKVEGVIDWSKWHNKKMGNGRYFDTNHIIQNAFYNTVPEIKKTEKYRDENGNERTRTIALYQDTNECKRFIDNLREDFMKYMRSLPAQAQEEITDIYNRKFNANAKKIDAKHSFYKLGVDLEGLKKIGISKEYDHQIEGSWQAVTNNGGIIDHEVGYGKTLTLVATAHNLKKYGKAKLPLILGLPANVNELAKTYQRAYPQARVLYAGKEEFSAGGGEEFFNKLRNNEYDVVIMSHTQLEKIPISDEIYLEEAEKEKRKVTQNLQIAKELKSEGFSVTDIKRLKKKLEEIESSIKRYKYNIEQKVNKNLPCLENIGIDHIIIDESHKFKNGSFSTRHSQVKGIGNAEGSKRANVLRYALRTIQKKNQADYGATFFSGTPITNALAELYILQDFLTPRALEEKNIASFDAWASTFIEKTTEIETNMVGNAVSTERFRKYMNMPQLSEMYNSMAHTRRGDNEFVKRPIQDVKSIVNELTPLQKKFNAKLVTFLKEKGLNERDLKLENPIKRDGGEVKALSLITTNLAWKSSLDMRLINSSYPDDPNSKINYMIESVLERYKRYDKGLGTQIIFCSESTSKEKLSYEQLKYNYENNIFTSLYDDIKYKLISRGIPENEIAFVQDYKDDKSKARLSKLMNEGKIRFLIGGIINAGTGLNIQKRLCGVTHLTLPWTPAELEQGNGRIYRAGNQIVKEMNNNHCEIRMCATKGTLDIYKSEFLARKTRFINQIREGASNKDVLIADEGDLGGENMALDMATLQAELSGDKTVLEKAIVDKKINELSQRIETTEKNYWACESKINKLKEDIKSYENVKNLYQRDFDKANSLIEYKGDKRVNKPIVEGWKDLEENYNEKDFANYVRKKYKEVKDFSLGESLKIGELYGFDMIMERSFEEVFCYVKTQEEPYRKYSYGHRETIDLLGSDTSVANYFSNCLGTIKNKLSNQEKGIVRNQEKLKQAEIEIKNEVVPPELYKELEQLKVEQDNLNIKLLESGGIRTYAEYEIINEKIGNKDVIIYRVTDDLKELDRALLYDQFGKEGDVGYVYLKKDSNVFNLFVNRFNQNGIEIIDNPIYNKDLDEYFVRFKIDDVDKLYIHFSEIINPRVPLNRIEIESNLQPKELTQEAQEEMISPVVSQEKQIVQEETIQLSLFGDLYFENLDQKEPLETVFEEKEQEEQWVLAQKYQSVPNLYETEDVESKDKQVHSIFYIPNTKLRWYLNEVDKNTGEAFGLCKAQEIEWGYFSIDSIFELGGEEIVLEKPKTYEELLNNELKENLTEEELDKAFYGKLTYEENLWKKLPESIILKEGFKATHKKTGIEFKIKSIDFYEDRIIYNLAKIPKNEAEFYVSKTTFGQVDELKQLFEYFSFQDLDGNKLVFSEKYQAIVRKQDVEQEQAEHYINEELKLDFENQENRGIKIK